MIRLYRTLIHSELNYGAHIYIYSFASQLTLYMLDPIQNCVLRLVTRAFCSSPNPSLQVDAHVLSLDLHRESRAKRTFLHPHYLPEPTFPL